MECRDFMSVDTTLLLARSNSINIFRNPSVYGYLRYKLWNPDKEQTAPNTEIFIDGNSVKSDTGGYVTLVVPLEKQKEVYPVTSKNIALENNIVGTPCGPDDVIIFK